MDVYINDIAAFLPNDPVTNDEMETVLGAVHNIPSRIKNRILKNNGIEKRYYAIDRKTGELNYTNARLTAEAVRRLKPYEGFSVNDIQMLCCGTSTPDVLLPGHGLMVQGELGIPSCEVITTAGICLCGITSFKTAYANVALGLSDNAVSTGSELASSLIKSNFLSISMAIAISRIIPSCPLSRISCAGCSPTRPAPFLCPAKKPKRSFVARGLDRKHCLCGTDENLHVRRRAQKRRRHSDRLASASFAGRGAEQ